MQKTALVALSLAALLASSAAHAEGVPGLPQQRAPGLPRPERDVEEQEFEEGMQVPPGHHLVKHNRPGLIAGGITLIVLGLASGAAATAIFAQESSGCQANQGACTGGGIALSVLGAGLGIGGGLMLNAGMAPKLYLVTDDVGRARFQPIVSASARGATFGLAGSF